MSKETEKALSAFQVIYKAAAKGYAIKTEKFGGKKQFTLERFPQAEVWGSVYVLTISEVRSIVKNEPGHHMENIKLDTGETALVMIF